MTPGVCLTMIVKNEAKILARCIESVRPMIDAWAIVDTGSSDNTMDVASHALADLPGMFTFAPWEGFGPARTRSLNAAEAVVRGVDTARPWYAMIVDADDIWSGMLDRTQLIADAHSVWTHRNMARWSHTRFLKLFAGWRYEGAIHEQPARDAPIGDRPFIESLSIASMVDGASWSEPDKYLRHAQLIARDLAGDPTNHRSWFYLAQSYRDHGDDAKAAQLYLTRAGMGLGPEPEQVYVAYLEAGRALWRLGRMDEAEKALQKAHQAYPGRREAMAELARLFAVRAATQPTVGTLFVEGYADEAAE